MGCIVLYNIAMDNTYYTSGKQIGKKAAVMAVKAPAAVVLYPAGFVVGFISAFLPERKVVQEQPTEIVETETQFAEVLNPA